MSLVKPGSDKKNRRDIRQIGAYAAIPGLLLAGPLVGYVLGWWLDGKLGTSPYLTALGVLMGIVASGIEIFELIKKVSEQKKDDDDRESGT